MTVDRLIIDALEAAVAKDPDSVAVRLHLASLLLVGGDAAGALSHAAVVLSAVPDSVEALVIARDAARASGDASRAVGYERLLGVLKPLADGAERPADPCGAASRAG